MSLIDALQEPSVRARNAHPPIKRDINYIRIEVHAWMGRHIASREGNTATRATHVANGPQNRTGVGDNLETTPMKARFT